MKINTVACAYAISSCNAFTLPEDTKYLIELLLYNGDCNKAGLNGIG